MHRPSTKTINATFVALLFSAVSCAASFALPMTAAAQVPACSIAGNVRARTSGLPIAGATVILTARDGATVARTASDRTGAFVVPAPRPGSYRLSVSVGGYRAATVAVTLATLASRRVDVSLSAATGIDEIGRIVARSSDTAEALPEQRIAAASAASEGALRLSDALGKVAGVDVPGDGLAPGGDAYVSLRGLRPGESRTLLDGHPIGPLGVVPGSPDVDGAPLGFDYQDAPYFALSAVDVSFGTSPSAIFGGDALAGTVDLRTVEPTARNEVSLEQGFGNEGRALTSLRASGTSGKFGYALVHGVVGTYGLFSGEPVAQTGMRGTDFTSATLAALTYRVSGDYVLRNELAKVVYAPGPGTRIELTSYDATSWADKTGEGDDDFNPYGYVLASAPIGASAACPHGVLVSTDSGRACLSPQAYAAAASGPAGGGPGAWQALRNQDDDLRVTAGNGSGAYTLDAFVDRYAFLYHRDASLVNGPLDAFLDDWSTQGARLADRLGGAKNALDVGFSWLRQTLAGNGTATGGSALVTYAPVVRVDRGAFVRDTFAPSGRLSLVLDAPLTKSTLDPQARFDPRFTAVYRPAPRDAIRLGAGRASEEPSLESARVNLVPAGALNPDCGAIAQATAATPADVNVGSGPAANLAAETASDLEFGYDHRFGNDSTFGLTAYDTNVRNRIVTGNFVAGTQLAAAARAPLLARIGEFCGRTPDPATIAFTLSRAFNVATARVRGVELAGRVRFAPHVAVDYGVDVQAIALDDLPASALQTDATLVNGAQAFGVPLHKANLAIDATMRGGLECRLEGHAVGPNNPQQLPGYAYADASLTQAVSKHASVLLAVSNVFGSHVQTYGLVGAGLPYATNAYYAALAAPDVQPFNERYGLPPASVTLTATLHL